MVDRLSKVETDLYSPSGNGQGLVSKVELLEKKIQQQPKPSSGLGSGATATGLQKQVAQLQATNQVLIGFAAKLQNQNNHLQNELYIQKDRQNILNLLLGGVSYIEGGTCKDEVLAFYHDILKMTSVKEQDIVKAYRKTQPRSYEEEIKKDQTTTKIQVNAPGLMFVHLSTETIRDTTIAKARSLAGQRDATHNFKYFASAMECEAVKATKEKHRHRIEKLLKDNETKEHKNRDTFHFHGARLLINGKPFQDQISTPTYAEVADHMTYQFDEIKAIQLLEVEQPHLEEGNISHVYAVRARKMDTVWLAYSKVFMAQPRASHIMMAYRLGAHQGACDDGEYKAGAKILRAMHAKKAKNCALFITREISEDATRQLGASHFTTISNLVDNTLDLLSQNATHSLQNSPTTTPSK